MQLFRDKFTVGIRPDACVILAAVLLILPLNWFFAWLLAIVVHELCHYLALKAMGVPVYSVCITSAGAFMETGYLTPFTEFFSALAGPLGALLLLLAGGRFPALSVCACIHSMFNLLPVFPLDGGRAFRCVLARLPRGLGQCASSAVEWFVLILGLLAGFYGTFTMKLGLVPLVGAACLFLRADRVKIPCKDGGQRVQ